MKPHIRPMTEDERAIYRWSWCVVMRSPLCPNGDGRAWFGSSCRDAWNTWKNR